jgi:arylsulfatase A-like enzyme
MRIPVVALVALSCFVTAFGQEGTGPRQTAPNFIVIFADDLGYGDLGCFGHPTIQTPHLDRMAAEGMKLTQFYAAASVCTPSRAGLLTGRLPVRSGVYGDQRRVLFPDSTSGLPASEVTLAEALRESGYRTACVGKWHLGHLPEYLPTNHGFDSYFGIPYSNDMDAVWPLPDGSNRFQNSKIEYFKVPLLRDLEEIERPADQTTITRRYTEEAVRFIKEQDERPFFLYLAHSLPHVPLFRSPEFEGRSRRGLYGDVVEEIDWGVGEILDALRETGLDEETVVLFTSDNGPWLTYGAQGGSAGLLREGKGCTFEGGMRVPAIVRWPSKVPAATVCAEVTSALDVMPTFVKLAGGELPADRVYDGEDVSSLLDPVGASQAERASPKSFFYYKGSRLMAVRHGAYKAHFATQIAYVGDKLTEHDPPLLFHLDEDPSESRNVAKKHPDVVQTLRRVADEHLAKTQPVPTRTLAKKADTAPNIVVILADDMGYGEVQALYPDGSRVPTPHLNRLYAESLSFTDAHSPSSVCTPTRYGLLTGRYCWRTTLQKGVVTGKERSLIAEDRLTLGGLLQGAGYDTAIVGKWHLNFGYEAPAEAEMPEDGRKTKTFWPAAFPIGSSILEGPTTRGFNSFFGFHHAREMSSIARGESIVQELEVDEVLPAITREAIAYIDGRAEAAKEGKPFFLYFPMSSPHTPIAPTEEWQGKSGLGAYGDFVAQTDASVGAVLEALDANGIAENTLVIFTTDNGTSRVARIRELQSKGHYPTGELRGSKADLWEGGHRVPFMVRWPSRVRSDRSTDQLVSLTDVLSTVADLLDINLPANAGEDSISFLPTILDYPSRAQRTSMIHHSIHGHFAIRDGDWKLLLAPGSGGWSQPTDAKARKEGAPESQLYQLGADLPESVNLQAEHPAVVARLTALLEAQVQSGRSTPGSAQANDTEVVIRKRN